MDTSVFTDLDGDDVWPEVRRQFLHDLTYCETVLRDLKETRLANQLRKIRHKVEGA